MQPKLQLRDTAVTNVSASPNYTLKKSLRNIREKSHQEFYNNRVSKITSVLTPKGYNLNALMTEDEILQMLDTLGKEPFSRDIALQLFEKIPFQEGGDDGEERRFVLEDFVETHIKAEYFLLLRAEEIEEELDELYGQVEAIKDEYQEALHHSDARIENNSLEVELVEVVCDDDDYQPAIGSMFSIVVVVGKYKYETEEVMIDKNRFNPKFNWTFHLKLDTLDEVVTIYLRDQRRYKSDENYSDLRCTIRLNNYKDQIRHVTWLTMYNEHRQPTKFKVHVVIQWHFSKIAYYEEKLLDLQALEERLLVEKEHVQVSLKSLVHPFASSVKPKTFSQGMKSEPNIKMSQHQKSDSNTSKQIEFMQTEMNVNLNDSLRTGSQPMSRKNSETNKKIIEFSSKPEQEKALMHSYQSEQLIRNDKKQLMEFVTDQPKSNSRQYQNLQQDQYHNVPSKFQREETFAPSPGYSNPTNQSQHGISKKPMDLYHNVNFSGMSGGQGNYSFDPEVTLKQQNTGQFGLGMVGLDSIPRRPSDQSSTRSNKIFRDPTQPKLFEENMMMAQPKISDAYGSGLNLKPGDEIRFTRSNQVDIGPGQGRSTQMRPNDFQPRSTTSNPQINKANMKY